MRLNQSVKRTALAAALVCTGTAGFAATLDEVALGSVLVSTVGVDIETADFGSGAGQFDAFSLFGPALFVTFPFQDLLLDDFFTFPTDLIYDQDDDGAEELAGSAVDLAIDYSANTISVLYDVSVLAGGTNTLSSDDHVIAVLSNFADGSGALIDLVEDNFSFLDLDFTTADAEVHGTAAIPLPASVLVLVTGLAGLGLMRRFQSA